MIRLIFYFIILLVIYFMVKRAFFPKRRKGSPPEAIREELVQDPFCQCYVPKSKSYQVSWKGQRLFFCSKECYEKYRAAKELPRS